MGAMVRAEQYPSVSHKVQPHEIAALEMRDGEYFCPNLKLPQKWQINYLSLPLWIPGHGSMSLNTIKKMGLAHTAAFKAYFFRNMYSFTKEEISRRKEPVLLV